MKPRLIAAAVLILIPLVVYLAIQIYNVASPELAGIPFYYWWQTLWLGLSAALFIGAAFLIDWGPPEERATYPS